jgi:phosphatidylinositol alpha-mannosyltransferase
MAAGTPVVASDLPAYREVGERGDSAVLVPAGDAVALADGVRSVLDDRALAAALRARGLRRARRWSMDDLAHRYEAIYEGPMRRTR